VNYVKLAKSYITITKIRRVTFEMYLKIIAMPLLTILLVLIAAGVLLWLVNSIIPMDGNIKKIFNVVVVIVVIIWLLKAFGIFHYLKDIHI
jgi:hypothetical protein